MTLPSARHVAAIRAAHLIDVVEALPEGTDDSAVFDAVAAALIRFDDLPDAQLRVDIRCVLDVIVEIGRLFDIDDVDRAAAAINLVFERHAAPPRLVHEPGWGWHLHADHPDADWANWLAASTALDLAALLSSRHHVPWGRCADPDCRRAFIDHGRRHPQRYCSDTCATRQRVRRHRAAIEG